MSSTNKKVRNTEMLLNAIVKNNSNNKKNNAGAINTGE